MATSKYTDTEIKEASEYIIRVIDRDDMESLIFKEKIVKILLESFNGLIYGK